MINLKDGTKIYDTHEQDCCETVFADWPEDIESDLNSLGITYETVAVEFVADFGIKMNGISVPCYDRQNGYYSSNLTLSIERGNEKKVFDLDAANAIKHEIY